jgi:hypothetical protein
MYKDFQVKQKEFVDDFEDLLKSKIDTKNTDW